MVEEKAGVEKQNSEKEFEKNEHASDVVGTFGFRIFLPVRYLKAAVGPGANPFESFKGASQRALG